METILRRTCAPWILLFSAGCAADDLKSVPLPAFESFDLGKTRYAQVVERMGEPNFGSQILIDGKTVKSVS